MIPYKALSIAIASAGVVWWLSSLIVERNELRAQIHTMKIEAREAQNKADKRVAEEKKLKEIADETFKKELDRVRADADRLRRARASSNFVPAPAPDARDPDEARFKRAELERALQQLDEEISGLIREGDEYRSEVRATHGWAAGFKPN